MLIERIGSKLVVVNDGERLIDEIVVEDLDQVLGPIAPGDRAEIPSDASSITIRVREGALEARWIADETTLESAPAPQGTIELDARGVRRWRADGTAESARWDRLVAIEIVKTFDDVQWVLHEDVGGCVVPSSDELVARMTALPGFDQLAMIDAIASTRDARGVVWRRPTTARG
ncbi:MAG TPA: hypothetical protein VL463_10470 [Kofleriaceae bacterium]|nr:hypothetical protein [Kofleriaceae bacterium]